MRKILNYFTGVIITFLFLIFNDLDAIPSKYRLGIAAVILIFDAIVLAYELINSMKKNKSAKVLLQENIFMISTFMILLILRISHLSQECKFVIAGVVSAKLYSVPKKDDQIIFDLIVLYSKLFFYLFAPWHEPVNLFWMLNDINLRHYLQYVFYVVKGIKPISFSCLNQAEY